jgi:hypothetical protein
MNYGDSTDRSIADYVLFGLAALGALTAGGAVVVASVPMAVLGLLVLLASVWRLWLRPAPGE